MSAGRLNKAEKRNLSDRRDQILQKIIENMSAQPATCVIASVLLFFFAALANYILMDGLLEMHRSKSALKKLKKQYTFFQKIRLLHFKDNCRHAVKFCNGMIIYQKIGWLCFAVYLLAGLLYAFDFFPAAVISWLSIAIFFCFDLPSIVISWALSRPLLFSQSKKFSFEKYHNTDNHESLF